MGTFWFIVLAVVVILWWRDTKKKNEEAAGYNQGYWDGYRAFGAKVAELLQASHIDKKRLQQLVDEGGNTAVATSYQNEPKQAEEEPEVDEVFEYEDDGYVNPEYINEPAEDLASFPPATTQPAAPATKVVAATVAPPPVHVETPAEKEARTLKNLNILLYVGSFLIVASMALFVTLTGMSAAVKLVSLVAITIVFYVAGLVLHAKAPHLRPAATAFAGTGLAILPFVGIALSSLGGMSVASAWLVTSVAGLVAYGVAAVRLQSQFVGYLTLAFVLSLSLSMVSSLSLPMLWYFIVVIGVSLVCNSIHYLAPKLLPNIFAIPVQQTGMAVVPVALGASLLVVTKMQLFEYIVLFGIATAHYLVVWLERRQLVYEVTVRVLAHFTVLLVAAETLKTMPMQAETIATFSLWWVAAAAAQIVYSTFRIRQNNVTQATVEHTFMGLGFGAIAMALLWVLPVAQPGVWLAGYLAVIGVLALLVAARLRLVSYLYVGLAASVLLLWVLARSVIVPAVPYEAVVLLYVALAAVGVAVLEYCRSAGRSRQLSIFMTIAVVSYLVMGLWAALLSANTTTIAWSLALIAVPFVLLSYIWRHVSFQIIGAIAGATAAYVWVASSTLPEEWQFLSGALLATGLLVAGASVHYVRGERLRRDSMVLLGVVTVASSAFATGAGSEVVARTALAVLMLAAVAGLAVRTLVASRTSMLGQIAVASYALFTVLFLILGSTGGEGWQVLTLAVATGIFWYAAWCERQALLLAIGNLFLPATLATAWGWLGWPSEWQLLSVAWASALAYFGMFWLLRGRQSVLGQQIAITFAWLAMAGSVFAVGESNMIVVRLAIGGLLAAALLAVAMRTVLADRAEFASQSSMVAYMGLAALALLVSANGGQGWFVLSLAFATALLWYAVRLERQTALLLLGNIAFAATLAVGWNWLNFAASWQLAGVAWIAAAVYYATYWLMRSQKDELGQHISLVSTWLALAIVATLYFFVDEPRYALSAVGSLVALALTVAAHGYLTKNRLLIELAAYGATLGLQKATNVLLPEVNMVVYAHWWAIVIGCVAWWRGGNVRPRAIVALAFVTASTGIYALIGTPGYSLAFLVEHLIILVAGALLRQQWAMWWGIVAVVVAVLYFLRGYTFLALLFLGFLLILFVIWRLVKMKQKQGNPPQQQ